MDVTITSSAEQAWFDRGAAYGDGVFETMRLHEGQVPLWSRHVERLQRGLNALNMPVVDVAAIEQAVLHAASQHRQGTLKLTVTRQDCQRGYRPSSQARLQVTLQHSQTVPLLSDTYQQGIAVRCCDTTLGEQPALAGIKHLNRLSQVLARMEWTDEHIHEGLMFNQQGQLICATAANVFVRRQGQWFTPQVNRCGVAGTLRAELLARFTIQKTDIPRAWLDEIDAMFLSNSLRGIMPVSQLDDQKLPIAPSCRTMMHSLWQAFPMYQPQPDPNHGQKEKIL